jgi:S1-C subfamily serine protease
MAALFLSSYWERIAWAANPQEPSRTNPPLVTDLLSISDRFEKVAKSVSPAVVYVEARKPNDKAPKQPGRVLEESGSGVIIQFPERRDYLVLTNNHVITGTETERIVVHLEDGRVFRPVRVWTDPESDVAVLAIESGERLPTARLGDSDQMQVGQWVLAIGSPFGLNQTVTHGIISARDRGQISLGSTIRIKEFLQTDAAINPGSSGGPLVNLNGEVIGLNTAIASPNGSNSGVAFSIPINLVRGVVQQLLSKGVVSRGYLGIQLASSLEPADALRLGLDRARGALVEIVYPDTPGAAAGLQPGDVIVELDGQPVRNENHLINWISSLPAGKNVTLTVVRDKKRLTLSAAVGDWSRGQDRLRNGQ